ncbi:MAG: HAD family phosphatase [Kiritimatiellae bacterium]|nr:HAD family phosphatase [Kiritimatiellia bacterium]
MSAARPLPPRPAALIFDFDGVLVDSEPLHCQTISETLVAHGWPPVPWDLYQKTLMGFDDRDAFRHAAPVGTSERDIAALVAEKAALFAALAEAGRVPPLPGAAEAVRRAMATGLPVALCSGALRSDVEPVLRHLDLVSAFPVLVTAEDVAHSKPDPESYRLVLSKLGVAPEKAIVFEDSLDGLLSATAAGIPVYGITTHLPPAVLRSHGAAATAPSLALAVDTLLA